MPENNQNIPLKYNGNIIGTVVINKDISEKMVKLVTQTYQGFNLNCKLRKNQDNNLEITEFFISGKR